MSGGAYKLPEGVAAIRFGSEPPPALGPDDELPTDVLKLQEICRDQAKALTMLHANLLVREEMIQDLGQELLAACQARILKRPVTEVLAGMDDVIARRFLAVPASEMSPGNGGRTH
jgi:hypothetical protein